MLKGVKPCGKRYEMAEKKSVLTKSGAEKLQAELKELKEVRRAEIAEKIKEARAQGDLSENAEYDAAKDEQAEIEARIAEIESTLKNSELVQEATDTKTVFVGAKVTVREEGSDEDEIFYIVGSKEANSLNNKISNESPLGAALMGAKVRQKVSYEVPAGKFTFTIKKIEKA